MAAGIWNKIWGGIKKAAKWVGDKVIKPVANVAKQYLPAIGTAVGAKFGGVKGAQIGNTVGGIVQGMIK
ncbi:hypothetical protein TVAG_225580 [Trichomonas vaginalis G3]|uniref:Uncharacterized protein n=1 Tax=Trichomonas vaginalis (strain ATCC PRA-98 / G3) TaxID=412133 RepID=A2DNT7_TRIV3|nr:hypothetical protein TVAGG3_0289000 [Trichomonas vaginalis G3]EAY17932.1 hypothetical protein TVAG_225580 [Trichomonas vaginalis G3]KAI5527111.1 hypothetical protein TVAGG3_0289000 [Trichomonas vaginalis G3]|eukprot:XP_001578918.1 hypothetical protein [Trichomonas vaginalis G3]